MNAKRTCAILLSCALIGCAHREKPLQVIPTQPQHPQLHPPPPELMELDCVFLPSPPCVKRVPK
jgi:hypothetical protein